MMHAFEFVRVTYRKYWWIFFCGEGEHSVFNIYNWVYVEHPVVYSGTVMAWCTECCCVFSYCSNLQLRQQRNLRL